MNAEITDEKLSKMLRQVRHMLEKADHPNTPAPEAEMCRNRAEKLITTYRLSEAIAVSEGTLSVKPIWLDFDMPVADEEFAKFYYSLADEAVRHVGARAARSWYSDEEGRPRVRLHAVGYSSDIHYMEMLMTACMVEFGRRLEPKYDPELSFEDNVYAMRHAGMERKRITKVLLGGWETENEMKAKNRKVTNAFKRACEARGEDWSVLLGRGNNVASYREDYAEAFVQTIRIRLMRLRNQFADEGQLVLRSRKENVDEAFYLKYPNLRPKPAGEQTPWKDPREGCAKCERAKSGYCRDHGYLRPSTAQPRGRYLNQTAASRGREAASLVNLGIKETRVSHPTTDRGNRLG